jgi:aminoglycoside phosphotransferase (APT) family kinase protein
VMSMPSGWTLQTASGVSSVTHLVPRNETSEFPPGVDGAALTAWMDANGLGSGALTSVEPVVGGTQNVMVRFERDGQGFVLRRGPLHLRPRSNDSIVREIRVLGALAATDVPHPRLIGGCDDPKVMGGAVFLLMAPVEGFNASVELPEPHASDARLRRQMGFEIVAALASLGAVDPDSVGLGDLGRPEGFIERQVPRWLRELDSYSELEGYPGPDLPHLNPAADWLGERAPESFAPGLMHGDFHSANVLFSRTGPEVAAIVDWEMTTVGDPLLDLGWLVATWELDGVPGAFGEQLAKAGGLASGPELIDAYGRLSDRDLSEIDWYVVLACFKLGILLEGTHARAAAGKAPEEVGDMLHAITLALFERARDVMEGTL